MKLFKLITAIILSIALAATIAGYVVVRVIPWLAYIT